MHILIIKAHPRNDGHTHEIARVYEEASKKAGHTVEILDIYDKKNLIPYCTLGGEDEKTKENISRMQSMVTWAHEVVVIHPIWWGTYPAALKNWVDAVFAPKFAYKYKGSHPEKLLPGKTAKIFQTSGGPGWLYCWPISPNIFIWKFEVFGFTGIEVIDYMVCGDMDINNGNPAPGKFEKFLKKVEKSALKLH